MAMQENTTEKPYDRLYDLLECYEALSKLVGDHEPAWLLLLNLNGQLRAIVQEKGEQGLLS